MRIGGLTSADKTVLRCHELEMRLVTQSLGFGKGELALVDATGTGIEPVRDKRRGQRGLFSIGRIFPQLVCHRGILAATVVVRRPWDWRCVIGMKSKTLDGLRLIRWDGCGWLELMVTCQPHKARVRTVCRMWPKHAWWHRGRCRAPHRARHLGLHRSHDLHE